CKQLISCLQSQTRCSHESGVPTLFSFQKCSPLTISSFSHGDASALQHILFQYLDRRYKNIPFRSPCIRSQSRERILVQSSQSVLHQRGFLLCHQLETFLNSIVL